ncbi:unnamed protein product [Cuscuta epithymum]|uniref:DUF1639 family protein n=1 Tax=Cuscuta epithymum TaxID=186058 RepID=A0AAV0FW76_9ASTE|nr:unnamed protein product [Cuscuta epithymum]
MGSHRSKPPLHNFTLPCGLKWGNRKFPNGKTDAVHRRSNGTSPEKSLGGRRPEAGLGWKNHGSDDRILSMDVFKNGRTERGWEFRAEVEDGIAAVREKLLLDLQAATDKMKEAILGAGLRDGERPLVAEEGEERPPVPTTGSETIASVGPSETARPWNLRTRRSRNKHLNVAAAVTGESNSGLKVDVASPATPYGSPFKNINESLRVMRSRPTADQTAAADHSTAADADQSPEITVDDSTAAAAAGASSIAVKRERAKFSVSLTRREIEEDSVSMIGRKPNRRPKKRAKYIQKNLDSLFPGLWLTEINADMYKVPGDQ